MSRILQLSPIGVMLAYGGGTVALSANKADPCSARGSSTSRNRNSIRARTQVADANLCAERGGNHAHDQRRRSGRIAVLDQGDGQIRWQGLSACGQSELRQPVHEARQRHHCKDHADERGQGRRHDDAQRLGSRHRTHSIDQSDRSERRCPQRRRCFRQAVSPGRAVPVSRACRTAGARSIVQTPCPDGGRSRVPSRRGQDLPCSQPRLELLKADASGSGTAVPYVV